VSLAAWLRLDKYQYWALHNVTIPTRDGTTQIDHIFVSTFGVFVVETKNYKGWIFGGEHQPTWTQKIYKQSFKFQNPLRQNYLHTQTLQDRLGIGPEAIHSVIVFVGDCEFKTLMPPNVCIGGAFVGYIKSKQVPVLPKEQMKQAYAAIQAGRLTPSLATSRQHRQHVQQKSAIDTPRLCPKCGSPMVERVAKSGARVGNPFWGCYRFPACRTVQTRG